MDLQRTHGQKQYEPPHFNHPAFVKMVAYENSILPPSKNPLWSGVSTALLHCTRILDNSVSTVSY